MERIFVKNFSGLKRIFRRCSSHQCDAARAADHDEHQVKIWINYQVSKTKKTVQKSGKRTKGSSLELSVPTYGCTGFCKKSVIFSFKKCDQTNSPLEMRPNIFFLRKCDQTFSPLEIRPNIFSKGNATKHIFLRKCDQTFFPLEMWLKIFSKGNATKNILL